VRVLSAGEMTQLHRLQRTAALAADQTEEHSVSFLHGTGVGPLGAIAHEAFLAFGGGDGKTETAGWEVGDGAAAAAGITVGPGKYCSPCQRTPIYIRNEGSECVSLVDDVAGNICQALHHGGLVRGVPTRVG